MKTLQRNVFGAARFFALAALGPFLNGADDWPQWLGPERNGHAATMTLERLPSDLAPVWKMNIGGGFSSPIVSGANLVYLDAQDGKETVHLIDAKSGKPVWAVAIDAIYQDEWGAGPRSTPMIEGDRLYVQSCRGEFRCLKLKDGETIWRMNFEKDFGVKFLGSKANEGTASRRGNNGCGVIRGGAIVVPVGDTNGATLVSFDKLTGKILWKSLGDEAAYSSLIIARLGGVEQVVAFTADALTGVEATTGKMLWRVPFKTNAKRHASTPLVFGDQVIVNSHTIGLVSTRIAKEGAEFKTSPAWVNRDLKINLATGVLIEGHFYCQGPTRNYVCVDVETGKLKWSQPGFGKEFSASIALGKQVLVLSDEGQLVLIAADPEKCRELGRVQVCGRTWSFPALAAGRLYVREGLLDGWKLGCFDLAKIR